MAYEIEQKKAEEPLLHTVKLESRKTLTITGVRDVDGFDEHTVVLVTDYGLMTVQGNSLHVSKLNIDDGQLNVSGEINSLQYSSTSQNKGSWMSRMFK